MVAAACGFWFLVIEPMNVHILSKLMMHLKIGWRRSNQSILIKSVLNIHWMDWCWSWNSNTLATWCEELTHWKRPLYWKRLKAGGEGGDRGWDGWMASLIPRIWVWVSSGSWWWTGRPDVLQSMGLQRVGQDWATELNWNILGKSPWGESNLFSSIFSLSGDYSRPIHYIGRYWVIGHGKVNSPSFS